MLLNACQTSTKKKGLLLAPQPHPYVLNAPQNIELWEPSAAVIIDNLLWVANDKPLEIGVRTWGVLAAYDLTKLMHWKQLRAACQDKSLINDLKTGNCDGNDPIDVALLSGQKKLEAGALSPQGTLWWDTKRNKAIVCLDSGQQQCGHNDLQHAPSNADLHKLVIASTNVKPNDLQQVKVEALAIINDRTWVGIRNYKTRTGEVFWTAIVNDQGKLIWGGGKLVLDGKLFTISDFSKDQQGIWVTLSYEKTKGITNKRNDVDGRLAWIALTPDGGFKSMHLCLNQKNNKPLVLAGKPEGIAVFGKQLAIVYDNDTDRKQGKPKVSDKFPIRIDQDYLNLIQKPDCLSGSILKTKG